MTGYVGGPLMDAPEPQLPGWSHCRGFPRLDGADEARLARRLQL